MYLFLLGTYYTYYMQNAIEMSVNETAGCRAHES